MSNNFYKEQTYCQKKSPKNYASRNENRIFTWHFKSPFYFISMQRRIWDMLNFFLISLTLLHSVIKYASQHNTDLYDMFHSFLNFFCTQYYFSFCIALNFRWSVHSYYNENHDFPHHILQFLYLSVWIMNVIDKFILRNKHNKKLSLCLFLSYFIFFFVF